MTAALGCRRIKPALGARGWAWRAAKASQALRQIVALDDHGRVEEGGAGGRHGGSCTPTGLELTEEFIKPLDRPRFPLNAPAPTVTWSKTCRPGGQTDSSGAFPWVQLNRDYLQTSADFRAPEVAATMAHELLGHGRVHYKAKAAGVVAVNDVYRNDDAYASLVGWIVSAVQGAKGSGNSRMWTFLANPEQFHRELHVAHYYYSGTFSLD